MTYTAAIAWDPATKVVTFTLSNAGSVLGSATFDLLQGTTNSPALAPPLDLSAESFLRGYVLSDVDGGATGGGTGSITAHYDDVYVGMNAAAPELFDDFEASTVFDATKWIVTGQGTKIVTHE
jgi:hypothetical protein